MTEQKYVDLAKAQELSSRLERMVIQVNALILECREEQMRIKMHVNEDTGPGHYPVIICDVLIKPAAIETGRSKKRRHDDEL